MPDNEIGLTLGLVADCVARFEKIELWTMRNSIFGGVIR